MCEHIVAVIDMTKSALYNQPDWLQLGIIISYAVVSLFGAVGNFLVIWIVARNPRMRTLRNYLIVNLAFSDFFMCTVTVPLNLKFLLENYWEFGSLACKVVASLVGINIFVSTLSTIAIGLDRYIITIFPTSLKSLKFTGILCVWLLAIVLAIPMFYSYESVPIAVPSGETFETFGLSNISEPPYLPNICGLSIEVCGEKSAADLPQNFRLIYSAMCFLLVYLLPLCSLIFFYARIVWRLKQRLRQRSANRTVSRERSAELKLKHSHMAHLLVCLVAVYAICWLPLMTYNVIVTMNSSLYELHIFAYCHITGMLSTCLNTIIYGVFNKNFREHFEDMYVRLRNTLRCQCHLSSGRFDVSQSPKFISNNLAITNGNDSPSNVGTQL